jgi:DNA-binding transcriptional LysR family regulator
MDTLVSLRVFCLVAELKSFTAAAERLGLSPAMASKHVMHLERRLATRLLNRTSRHVSLTETGALYVQQARQSLDALDEAESAVSNTTVAPRGTLRLSAPVWMANPAFVAVIADYRARYPDVRLDIDLSGRMVSLVDEGFDLALRATSAPDPGLIARAIADIPFHLVAAPAWLERTGRPGSIAALKGRPFLAYSLVMSDGAVPIDGPCGRETVRFDPVLQSANETLLHLAALQGMGLTFLPKWLIEQDLAEGRLERVLPEVAIFRGRLYAVYPSRKYLSAKVRTFLDFVASDARLK